MNPRARTVRKRDQPHQKKKQCGSLPRSCRHATRKYEMRMELLMRSRLCSAHVLLMKRTQLGNTISWRPFYQPDLQCVAGISHPSEAAPHRPPADSHNLACPVTKGRCPVYRCRAWVPYIAREARRDTRPRPCRRSCPSGTPIPVKILRRSRCRGCGT